MKKILFLLFIGTLSFCQAQVTVSDVNDKSQFNVIDNEDFIFPEVAEMDFSNVSFVSSNHQIPSYSLYDREWSAIQLKTKDLEIPFSHGKLMVILVSETNNPFIFPCRGQLARNYGVQKRKEFHPGIDFSLQMDDQIYCCFDGVVRMATEYGDYGKMVVVRHYNGLETVYARLGKVYVKPGQIISAGHILGRAGTENNKGTLHFETRFMNEFFNPEILFNVEERALYSNNLFLKEGDFQFTKIPVATPVREEPQPEVLQPDTVSEPLPEKEKPVEPKKEEPGQQAVQYHIVVKGETLYRISVKYNIPIDDLIRINNLSANGAIREGQKLRVSR